MCVDSFFKSFTYSTQKVKELEVYQLAFAV